MLINVVAAAYPPNYGNSVLFDDTQMVNWSEQSGNVVLLQANALLQETLHIFDPFFRSATLIT